MNSISALTWPEDSTITFETVPSNAICHYGTEKGNILVPMIGISFLDVIETVFKQ
jgi:hypothetical protein